MSFVESKGKCFTFVWKLENISACLQRMGERIESPSFVVDAIHQTKWNLWLYPRGYKEGNNVGFFLYREEDSEGPDNVEIKYELCFLSKDNSVLTFSGIVSRIFPKGTFYGFGIFQKREDVFFSKKSTFLPEGILRARCRIWDISGGIQEDILCTACTHFKVEKLFFQWDVRKFNRLVQIEKCSFILNSMDNELQIMSIDLCLIKELNLEEIIRLEVSLRDKTIKFATLNLFLVNGSGTKIECNKEEIWFNDPELYKTLTFSFTKIKLLEQKSVYLPKDTLSLLWEWAFSRGDASVQIEEDTHGCIHLKMKTYASQLAVNDRSLLNSFVDNMKSLYEEHFLSDVKLKTNTSEFPAHKFILSAQSSVFKSMFSTDMKETNRGCVYVEDLSDDTIRRMLLFMYTTRVEDLTCERASNLYIAADKYAILSLKDICSSYLKKNLSPSNACEVLVLSDLRTDLDLKSAVQDYIVKHGKQIINSDYWKSLMETNAKLAAETLCLLFK